MAASHGGSMFNFCRNCWTAFPSGCSILQSRQYSMSVLVPSDKRQEKSLQSESITAVTARRSEASKHITFRSQWRFAWKVGRCVSERLARTPSKDKKLQNCLACCREGGAIQRWKNTTRLCKQVASFCSLFYHIKKQQPPGSKNLRAI